MGDEPHFEVPCVADAAGGTGNIQIFRENEFDVPDADITAGFSGVSGDRHGFQAAFRRTKGKTFR